MYILGINGSTLRDGIFSKFGGMHNSGACLLKDGKLLAFVEEERFAHIKQYGGFPLYSIRYCLETAGISMEEVDHVAYGWKNPWGIFSERLTTYLRTGLFFRVNYPIGVIAIDLLEVLSGGLGRAMKRHFGPEIPPITCIEHHRSHASSSFRCSGFDEATLLNIDGSGETTTTYFGHGVGNEVRTLDELIVPNSLGRAYAEFTQYLGFMPNNDEYKVMGLASYGEPTHDLDDLLRTTPEGFECDPSYFFRYDFLRGRYKVDKLEQRFGPRRLDDDQPVTQDHKNIAASLQGQLEKIGLHLVDRAVAKTSNRKLCLSGGVALNVKLNGEILQSGLVDELFIQPVSNDAGVALGAALELHARLGHPSKWKMEHLYYGPEYDDEQVDAALERSGLDYQHTSEIEAETAEEIAGGKIIGWFQGRMEVGPRALGNRSILADPTVEGMDDKVNAEIKFREKWRPFCPSMHESAKQDYLENACESPFMILTFKIREEQRKAIPAIVHIDGTARPQTVKPEINPRYHKLIGEFATHSGHPVLMNTSFNIKGDTIVNTPEDAIRTYLDTGMDVLSLGNFIVRKKTRQR
jgi:carbamoyltransferase